MADKGPAEAARVLEALNREIDHLTSDELLELGHLATTVILLRTKQGLDADRKPFRPYSAPYVDQRKKAGLSAQPDLVRKGHMLGAMLPTVTGADEVTVHFASSLEATKAAAHNFGNARQPKREFLDIRHPDEIKVIEESLGKGIASRVEKVLTR